MHIVVMSCYLNLKDLSVTCKDQGLRKNYVGLVVFVSSDCLHCKKFMKLVPIIKKTHNIPIKLLDAVEAPTTDLGILIKKLKVDTVPRMFLYKGNAKKKWIPYNGPLQVSMIKEFYHSSL